MLRFGLRYEDLLDVEVLKQKYDKFYLYCKEIFNVVSTDETEWTRLLEMR